MRGKIIAVNYQSGMAAYDYNDGEYGYFEILGSDAGIEPGTECVGNLESLGGETITLLPLKEKVDVYIQDFSMSRQGALNAIE